MTALPSRAGLRACLRGTGLRACLALTLFATSANAQTLDQLAGQGAGSLDVERLRPALDANGILDVEGGEVGDAGELDAALWMNASLAPLTLRNPSGVVTPLVSERIGAHLTGNFVIVDGFALGVEVPVVVWQSGPALVPGIAGKNPVAAFGLDDVRVAPKLALLSSDAGALALTLHTTLPTSLPRHQYVGDGLPTVEPELDSSTQLGPVRLALDVGAKLRAASRFGGAVQGSEVTARAGASLSLRDLVGVPVTLDATVNGAWLPLDAPTSTTNNPIEGLAGIGVDVGAVHFFAAAGTALLGAPGTPSLRGLGGVRWSPRCDDADKDGVCGDVDRCPSQAEDADGVEDSDGCLDADVIVAPVAPVDSDNDGVRDLDDVCPNEAEDLDGILDTDGCGGPDEDNDGLLDGIDRCPADAESKDNVDDGDGCPEVPASQLRGIKRDTVPLGGAVSFVPKTSKLDANGMLALDTAISYLKNTTENVRIDVAPATVEAIELSKKDAAKLAKLNTLRETAIKKYLVKNGVSPKRVVSKGDGDIKLEVRAD
jgi:hypothetical protein